MCLPSASPYKARTLSAAVSLDTSAVTCSPEKNSQEIEPQFEWLFNTEWKGTTTVFALKRGGVLKATSSKGEKLRLRSRGRGFVSLFPFLIESEPCRPSEA